ncbi:DoxX family protein [Pseudonocardia spinosispora]|uniref:DoxX family protein n=1 Tax=Pseudonocardia spinosispora TaxID=103441 RepID=UPI0006859307|nr:DoxX family protein [Pseudonocardia spinosispora]
MTANNAQPPTEPGDTRPDRRMNWAGMTIGTLVVLFLLVDAVSKLLASHAEASAAATIGFDPGTLPVIGTLLLISVALYSVPQTSLFGAVLITAYLGGALCATLRIHAPLPVLLIPVVFAIPVWLGLYLRSAALRKLVRHGL